MRGGRLRWAATLMVGVGLATAGCGADDVTQTPVTAEPARAQRSAPTVAAAPTTSAGTPPPSFAAVPMTTGAGAAPPSIAAGASEPPASAPAIPPATPVTVPLDFDDAWVLDPAPDGFVAVLADDLPEWREILYQRVDRQHQIYDAPIVVAVGGEQRSERYLEDVAPVVVRGRNGWSGRMQSDGVLYGTAVVWPIGEGRWVRVAWQEPEVSVEQVVALAERAVPVDVDEWDRLSRALSIDSHVGRTDPEAVEVVAIEGEADGVSHRLLAFIPSDYPLGADDRRQSCFQLEVDGQRLAARCEDRPTLERVGDQVFVYGRAPGDAPAVTVRRTTAEGEGPSQPAVTAYPDGSPTAFFLAVVPGDWCAVLIDGAHGPGAGPLPGDPFHAECLAQAGAG